MAETQMIHLDMANGDPLKDDFRQNLSKIITAHTYEIFEEGRQRFGTADLVVMLNVGDDYSQQAVVFTREQLLADLKFPANLRERITMPARLSTNFTLETPAFWTIVLWRKSVAALAVGFQHMTPGGNA